MSKEKHEHLIVRRPMNVNELPDHELGEVIPFPVLMCRDLVPEAKAWACYMFIKEITQEMIDLMDTVGKATEHRHDFDELYLMIGDKDAITFEVMLGDEFGDKDAITFEVMLGDEFYEVATPASVYLPKGLPHSIRPIKATAGLCGGLIPVCMNGEYTTL
jgi:hypothetical protein